MGVGSLTSHFGRFIPGTRLVTKTGWVPGSVRTGTINIASTGIRFPDRQDRNFLITSLINYLFILKRSVIIVSPQEQQITLHRQSHPIFFFQLFTTEICIVSDNQKDCSCINGDIFLEYTENCIYISLPRC